MIKNSNIQDARTLIKVFGWDVLTQGAGCRRFIDVVDEVSLDGLHHVAENLLQMMNNISTADSVAIRDRALQAGLTTVSY